MKSRQLAKLGIPGGPARRHARDAVRKLRREGIPKEAAAARLRLVVADPEAFLHDRTFGPMAAALLEAGKGANGAPPQAEPYVPRRGMAPYARFGNDLDAEAIQQIENACSLPVSMRGAIMPDAHIGYGLPIGGVLAVRNAVIPYAVGVDIACRMKLTVLDIPLHALKGEQERLANAIERETRFGIGSSFKGSKRRDHPVMERDWRVSPVTGRLKDKAWSQLGTSGSGNHFVEFGVLTVSDASVGLPAGEYLALLSHSGSRGAGATVANHYSKLAMRLRPDLPRHLRHLAWLDLDSEPGIEYWEAMMLMGAYAAANHALIHEHVARALGAGVMLDVENHHNFAWKEIHDGEEVIVHRKGATPAGKEDVGIIPGSMASPGFIVRGKGNEAALRTAAHGAGRRMSRRAAKEQYRWAHVRQYLQERNVTLLSAGLDEVPMAYKDIHEVMAAQVDLVHVLARFDPRIVKMAPAGERPED